MLDAVKEADDVVDALYYSNRDFRPKEATEWNFNFANLLSPDFKAGNAEEFWDLWWWRPPNELIADNKNELLDRLIASKMSDQAKNRIWEKAQSVKNDEVIRRLKPYMPTAGRPEPVLQ